MARKTFDQVEVLGLYTETSLHCGAESGTGYVDLPVQRERHTGYPVIQGSTVKGVLKDEMWPDLEGETRKTRITQVFGSEDAKTPGTASFGDGILAAFPVRSSTTPFHWVTCPFVLERISRLLGAPKEVAAPAQGAAWGETAGEVLLEETRLKVEPNPKLFGGDGSLLQQLLRLLPDGGRGFAYTREIFPKRLLVASDEDFGRLVETATEIVTRIKLNYLGTTENLKEKDHPGRGKEELQGNMFVQELVPPETLFACPLRALAGQQEFLNHLPPVIRLGGDETIGRGVTHVTRATGNGR